MKSFNNAQFRQLLGIIYVAGGAALFFFFAAEFVFRIALAVIGLIIMWRGLQLLGIDIRSAVMHHYIRHKTRR